MQGSRQEQEFVFVSKKDIEERKKKREEQTNNVKVGMWLKRVDLDYKLIIVLEHNKVWHW